MIRSEGLILKSIPYRELDQILKIFTLDRGLISVIVKWGRSKKKGAAGALVPLTRVEVIYAEGKGDLHRCHEISPIHQYSELRTSYHLLEQACEMANAISRSQWVERPAEQLYQLAVLYLSKMSKAKDPAAIAASFKLKVLRHEGLLHFQESCQICKESATDYALSTGEVFCKRHAPADALHFNELEWPLISQLALAKTFSELKELKLPSGFNNKIEQLFSQQLL